MPPHLISPPASNTQGRELAVGDIHGAFSSLRRAMDAVGFGSATDRLFCVGDWVDRGPESHEVLHWLDQPRFHAICGDHDYMDWRRIAGDPFPSVAHQDHEGEWLNEVSKYEAQRIGERLALLPIAMEIETPRGLVGLVHADCPVDDWRDLYALDWSRLGQMDNAAGQCLWSKTRYRRRYEANVLGVRAVVHGHITLSSMVKLGNAYFIDTGGWKPMGWFTFLDLRTLETSECAKL